MKRFLILIACAALFFAGATAARAETIAAEYTGPVAVAADLDSSNPTYDLISVVITGISGSSSSTDKVTMLSGGKWSVTGSADVNGFYMTGTDSTWEFWSLAGMQGDFPTDTSTTCFNFGATTGALKDGSTPAFRDATSAPGVFGEFGDTWYSGNTADFLPVGSTLAVLWVTKDWTTISYGDYDATNWSGISTVDLGLVPETITIQIPEPGALALLAAGLIGLLAYAWRRR